MGRQASAATSKQPPADDDGVGGHLVRRVTLKWLSSRGRPQECWRSVQR